MTEDTSRKSGVIVKTGHTPDQVQGFSGERRRAPRPGSRAQRLRERRLRQRKARIRLGRTSTLAILAAVLFVSAWGASSLLAAGETISVKDYGAKGDGVTDDTSAFQAALDAAPAGSTVVVPPASYLINSTLEVKSGVTLSGPGATLRMPAKTSHTGLLDVNETTGVSIVGLRLVSDFVSPHSYVIGIAGQGGGAVGLTLRDIRTENMFYGIKLGSSGVSRNVTVENWVGRNDHQNAYLANVHGGFFRNLDLHAREDRTKYEHHLYLEKLNEDLTFDTVKLTGGVGYAVQLYHGSTAASDRGKRITFRHLRIDGNEGIVVQRYDGVRFEDTIVTRSPVGSAIVVLRDTTGVTFDGWEFWDNSAAFAAETQPMSNISIRNGIYHQPTFMTGQSLVSGLVVENVSAGGSSGTPTTSAPTTTTKAPTTTSTAAPTTTTTKAPTTATTDAQSPATTVPGSTSPTLLSTNSASGQFVQTITYSKNDALNRGSAHYTGSQQEAGRYAGNIASGGWRFPNVNIPRGSVITSARLKLYAYAATGTLSSVRTRFYGEAADNPGIWATGVHEAATAARGSAYVNFNPTSWSPGIAYTMPDLKALVQEIINRPGWAAGNALGLIWTDNGSAGSYSRVASYDYGQNPAYAAQIEIEWTYAR